VDTIKEHCMKVRAVHFFWFIYHLSNLRLPQSDFLFPSSEVYSTTTSVGRDTGLPMMNGYPSQELMQTNSWSNTELPASWIQSAKGMSCFPGPTGLNQTAQPTHT
jgi:hypothetical protein